MSLVASAGRTLDSDQREVAKVTAAITTSVDGYVAGPNDGLGNGGEDAAWISELIVKMGAVVGGRATYEA